MKNMRISDFSRLDATEILRLLEEPTEDRRPLKRQLQKEAPVKELIEALRNSENDLTSRILSDILAARRAKTAIPVLIGLLNHPSINVREDTAEALGKIGSVKAGEALLRHFTDEPLFWYAMALGAINYRPAIPHLISALKNSSALVRGGAAWSLEELNAVEAADALKEALLIEEDEFVISHLRKALDYVSPIERQDLSRDNP